MEVLFMKCVVKKVPTKISYYQNEGPIKDYVEGIKIKDVGLEEVPSPLLDWHHLVEHKKEVKWFDMIPTYEYILYCYDTGMAWQLGFEYVEGGDYETE